MKIALLVIYFGVMVAIGIYCRKHTSGINNFVLGGRSVGPWLTAFAYGTSYFSAVVFIGYAGQFGWKYGIAATWAGIGNAILGSLLVWVVLGRRTRIMTQHFDSTTMPQFFGQRFQSPSLKIGASIIIFIFLIPYTASLFNGLSRLFGMAFNIDYTVCIILMGGTHRDLCHRRGYMATAINDFVQGCIMLVGICAVVGAILNTQGGFSEALHNLAAVSDSTTTNGDVPGIYASFFGPEPVNLLGVVLLTSLGTWGLPQMVQKFYAIKSEDAIHKGTVISTIFALVVSGGCYFMGGFWPALLRSSRCGHRGVRCHRPHHAVQPAGTAHCHCSNLGPLGLHVYPVCLGDDLFLHHHVRFVEGQHGEKNERLPGRVHHPVLHCGVYHHLHGHRHYPVQLLHQFYRTADGRVLGCAGRRFPGPPSFIASTGKRPPRPPAGPPSSLAPA